MGNTMSDQKPFKVGDTVECIDAFGRPQLLGGAYYFVEEVEGRDWVRLAGVTAGGAPCVFGANRFILSRRPALDNPITAGQKGTGTMSDFTAQCVLMPNDTCSVRLGPGGLWVTLDVKWVQPTGVRLSDTDATRLCAYLIEQGFGPTAEADASNLPDFETAEEYTLRTDKIDLRDTVPMTAEVSLGLLDDTVTGIGNWVGDLEGVVNDLKDTVKDAHERIDELEGSVGAALVDLANANRKIDELDGAHERIDDMQESLGMAHENITDVHQRLLHLERRLNAAASELKG